MPGSKLVSFNEMIVMTEEDSEEPCDSLMEGILREEEELGGGLQKTITSKLDIVSLFLASIFLFSSAFQAGMESVNLSQAGVILKNGNSIEKCLPKIWLYDIFLIGDS